MTNEERDLIARFISRVGGAPQTGGFLSGSTSVPQSQPALPPIDREADGFISQQFQQYPDARYRITQTAIVQEAALAEASNRIRRLEWELEQTRQAVQQAPQQAQNKGFFGSLFGGGSSQPARPGYGPQPGYGQQPGYGGGFQPTSAPPQPQYPPSYQPGMFQRGGSGFLGSALTTAAGVAGGMVVGNALMNAFGSHSGAGGALASGSSPWDSSGVSPTDPTGGFVSDQSGGDPFGGGGFGGTPQGGDPFGGGGFDQASADPGGFDSGGSLDGGGFGGGGFDDNQA